MEKKSTSPAKPDAEESSSAVDETLLTDFAIRAEEAFTKQDIHMDVDADEEEQPLTERTPETTPEKKKEGPSSAGKKKTKETPTASFSKKTTADSSHTESANTETKATKEKEVSDEASSGDAGGEDEEEKIPAEGEGDEDDVQVLEKRTVKRAKTVTCSSRKGKASTDNAKELIKNKEVVVPKRLELELLKRMQVKDDIVRLFKGIGWGKFLEWDTTVYAPLAKEFYGDLDIDHDRGVPKGIQFTLLGERRGFTVDELNQALKMVTLMEAKTASL